MKKICWLLGISTLFTFLWSNTVFANPITFENNLFNADAFHFLGTYASDFSDNRDPVYALSGDYSSNNYANAELDSSSLAIKVSIDGVNDIMPSDGNARVTSIQTFTAGFDQVSFSGNVYSYLFKDNPNSIAVGGSLEIFLLDLTDSREVFRASRSLGQYGEFAETIIKVDRDHKYDFYRTAQINGTSFNGADMYADFIVDTSLKSIPTPEPSSGLLCTLSLVGFAAWRRMAGKR